VGERIRRIGRRIYEHVRVPGFGLRRRRGRRAVTTQVARNGSVAIAYDVRGQGPPLVLLHGLGVGRWGWEPVVDRLARRFRVITVDNRGIGASDAPVGSYSTRAMASDVVAVLDDVGVASASVAGTSLGGMIAQELALAHPERVDRLVLVATIPGGRLTAPMPLKTAYLLTWAPLMRSEQRLRGFVEHNLGPETLRRRPRVVRRLMALKRAHPQSEQAWRAQATAGVLFDPLGRQRRISQPTLIVQGTADQVVNPVNAEVLAELISGARLRYFEEAGHLVGWEEPRRFARVVARFLTDRALPLSVRDQDLRRVS
jgi:pimeloyl-ACP methyl ester carboxylesterase